jgi:hypothetical protein
MLRDLRNRMVTLQELGNLTLAYVEFRAFIRSLLSTTAIHRCWRLAHQAHSPRLDHLVPRYRTHRTAADSPTCGPAYEIRVPAGRSTWLQDCSSRTSRRCALSLGPWSTACQTNECLSSHECASPNITSQRTPALVSSGPACSFVRVCHQPRERLAHQAHSPHLGCLVPRYRAHRIAADSPTCDPAYEIRVPAGRST